MNYATYIYAAYLIAAVVLGGVALQSWLAWLKIRKDVEKPDA